MATKTRKPATRGFTVIRTRWDGEFRHLYLKLIDLTDSYGYTKRPQVEVRWQADHTTDGWYGARLHVEADGNDQLSSALKLAHALGVFYFFSKPADLIERLIKKGWVQCVFDSREGAFFPISEIADGNRYVDDSRVTGYNSCTVSVIAPDNEIARQMIAAEFAAKSADTPVGYSDSTTYGSRYDRWLRCGSPIVMADTKPDVQPYTESLSVN